MNPRNAGDRARASAAAGDSPTRAPASVGEWPSRNAAAKTARRSRMAVSI